MPSIKMIGVALSLTGLSACTSLPKFSGPPIASRVEKYQVPKVDEIVRHVQCELIDAIIDPEVGKELGERQFAAFVSLQIEVTDDGSFNPTLGFVHALTAADTKRVIGISGQYAGTAHRTYTEAFTVVLDKRAAVDRQDNCKKVLNHKGSGLVGDLGVKQVLWQGLFQSNEKRLFLPLARGKGGNTAQDSAETTFGSTLDFTVVYSGGIDPVWTLTNFEGPGGGNASFVNYARTSKDTLTIGFAPVAKVDGKQPEAEANAASAAQKHVERMILQGIRPK